MPLRLNKLDLKDYLWHAYGVPVLRVRSYVQQQKVVADKPGALLPRRNRWYRPRAKKRMTVEMADEPGCGPFVWPEEVDDFEPCVLNPSSWSHCALAEHCVAEIRALAVCVFA